MSDFDVIIVGGGIAGASLGAEIAAKRRTLIVEAEDALRLSLDRAARRHFICESYGGPEVAKLTIASREFLDHPPADFSEHGFLRRRGATSISRVMRLPELPPDGARAA